MGSLKLFSVIAVFVMNCFDQIFCNQLQNYLLNDLISIDKHDPAELVTHNTVVESILDVSKAELSTTEHYSEQCPCSECHWTCPGDDQKSMKTMFLLTASEVVLGTAIIMGLSALITVLLRVCARPRYVRNSLDTSNVPEEFGRTGMRVSLTSLQQRVMSKLRDKPPRYETRHNYEYQRREISNRIAVLNPGAMFVPNVPPPTYELSDNSTAHELPPAYTIAIQDPGGALNQSLSIEERTTMVGTENATSEIDINTTNRTSENVLHI